MIHDFKKSSKKAAYSDKKKDIKKGFGSLAAISILWKAHSFASLAFAKFAFVAMISNFNVTPCMYCVARNVRVG